MAVCENHNQFLEFLNERVATELTGDGACGNGDRWRASSVIQNTAIFRSLEKISPEEAQTIYDRVFGLYPQFTESLKAELEKKSFG